MLIRYSSSFLERVSRRTSSSETVVNACPAARSIPTGSLANAVRWLEEQDRGAESTLGSEADRNRNTSATRATTVQCQTVFFRV